jgi:transcriptional regulator with XRE-family HTH domain
MGDVLKFSAISRRRRHLLAQNTPRDVGPQLFALDGFAKLDSGPLDGRAVLGRDAVLEPGLDRLVPVILDVERPGRLHSAPEDCDCLGGGLLRGGVGLHGLYSMQENLVLLERLALAGKPSREKLASMSIHQTIKTLREAKGWSFQTLADEIEKHEKRGKVLAWQAIQQWEDGVSAPTRKRMPFVATALGVGLEVLQGLSATAQAERAPPPPGADQLLSAYALIPEEFRPELVEFALNLLRAKNPDVARLMPAPEPAPPKPPRPRRQGFIDAEKTKSTIGKSAAKKKRAA